MFLKNYSTEPILAATIGVDEKTFRKWCWFDVEGIAQLDGFVLG
jgi:hypothetical protein